MIADASPAVLDGVQAPRSFMQSIAQSQRWEGDDQLRRWGPDRRPVASWPQSSSLGSAATDVRSTLVGPSALASKPFPAAWLEHAEAKLEQLRESDWRITEGVVKVTEAALIKSRDVLREAAEAHLEPPCLVRASMADGVAITFNEGRRYVTFEAYNDGVLCLLLSDREAKRFTVYSYEVRDRMAAGKAVAACLAWRQAYDRI